MKISAQVGDRTLDVTVERADGHFRVVVDGVEHLVDAHKLEADFYSILVGEKSYEVSIERRKDAYHVRRGGHEIPVRLSDPSRRGRDAKFSSAGPERIESAMPGRVVRLLVAEGDTVEAGQGVIVIEAMKMENEISSQKGGKVTSIEVSEGQSVEGGSALLTIE